MVVWGGGVAGAGQPQFSMDQRERWKKLGTTRNKGLGIKEGQEGWPYDWGKGHTLKKI